MKRAARAMEWAKLVVRFHDEPKLSGIPFGDACFCGGRLHKWGDRPDDIRCPARNTKRQKSRMDALGEVIRGR